MEANDLIIRVGGEGGEGIISTGDFIAKAAARDGFHVLTFKTFPAEIKGGYAMYQTRMSSDELLSEGDGFQVLVVFNKEALDVNRKFLKEGTVLVYDAPGGDINEEDVANLPGVTKYNIPMSEIAKHELQNYRSKNMVAMGAMTELFNLPRDTVKNLITEKFASKGDAVLNNNYAGFEAGQNYARENHTKSDPFKLVDLGVEKDTIIISGNEAIGLGALVAGCNFFSCYPITPATEVAIMLSKHLPKANGKLVQAEDEIASIANVIGASYAGAKAMTATSGPGVSLMLELLGLASIAELPVVVADVQRGGPSTGLPTKHEQSDLFIAAHGGHGDMSRIVLSPNNVADCFYLTIEAFNLAEKYQIPVLLLSDGSLGFRTETIHRPDLSKIETVDREIAKDGDPDFQRYKNTESGISVMAVPGQSGLSHMATGLEHSEAGAPRYTPENHTMMLEKRFRKIENVEDSLPPAEVQGEADADVGVIAWGSTQGAVREAVDRLIKKGKKVKALHPKLVWPVPVKAINSFAEGVKTILVPEVNFQGQFAELIKAATTIRPVKYNIYGGLPFMPENIERKIEELL
ncbi:MAG: 2-oxoacid:acceptor oxidoreductase subunit alpha [Thermodesulfobacteriota bacterium]